MDLYEGAIVDVTVTSVRDFGVLVRFGDREGVILIVNIDWHPFDVYKKMFASFAPGQRVRVKILVDAPRQFSCSIKDLYPEQDPWWDPSIYVVGEVGRAIVQTVFDHGPALLCFPNGAQVLVEQIAPGTKAKDAVDVMITAVHAERRMLEGRQVS